MRFHFGFDQSTSFLSCYFNISDDNIKWCSRLEDLEKYRTAYPLVFSNIELDMKKYSLVYVPSCLPLSFSFVSCGVIKQIAESGIGETQLKHTMVLGLFLKYFDLHLTSFDEKPE